MDPSSKDKPLVLGYVIVDIRLKNDYSIQIRKIARLEASLQNQIHLNSIYLPRLQIQIRKITRLGLGCITNAFQCY